MYRISEGVTTRVLAAIEGLEVLQAIRDTIGWEVSPFLLMKPGGPILAYMIALGLPVPGAASAADQDHVLYMHPLEDPHAPQEDVDQVVRELYRQAQEEADAIRARIAIAGNGHKRTPGGLYPG
jgi:hypothetical protein